MIPNAYCFRQELDSVNTVLIDFIYLATYVQDVGEKKNRLATESNCKGDESC